MVELILLLLAVGSFIWLVFVCIVWPDELVFVVLFCVLVLNVVWRVVAGTCVSLFAVDLAVSCCVFRVLGFA